MAKAASFLMTVILASSAIACSQTDFNSQSEGGGSNVPSNGPSNEGIENEGVVTPPTTSGSYFLLKSYEPTGVIRSSELKLESGSCFLRNFYDFPDWIFEDSSLDNVTFTSLDIAACGRLALAETIKANGACTPQLVALSEQERSAIQVDPAVFGMFAGLSLNGASVNLQLSQDCLCSLKVIPQASSGLNAEMLLPPDLSLCASKFAVYSAF